MFLHLTDLVQHDFDGSTVGSRKLKIWMYDDL